MKRTLWIIAMVLVIAAGTIVALYLFRKNKALKQYIHPQSHAVVSIAVDDLLLDNISSVFTQRTDSTPSASGFLTFENWTNAGIYIPAHIHFFSLKDHPLTFYTIQKITSPEKWGIFLKQQGAAVVQPMGHAEQPFSFAHLYSGVDVLYNDQYLLFRFTGLQPEENGDMHAIWKAMDSWVYIEDLDFHSAAYPQKHISYRHTDGAFQLFAEVAAGHIQLSGSWNLNSAIPTLSRQRILTEDDAFITLRSNLPLRETPFIPHSLASFSDLDPKTLALQTFDYVDVLVRSATTVQHDTIISYDYDEDFNSIEKKEIQESSVPVIESLWKGGTPLAAALPGKLFYQFNKYITDSLILLSTKQDKEFTPTFASTSSPFSLKVDFRHLPSSWDQLFAPLRRKSFQITLETVVVNPNRLDLSGQIQYDP